MEDKINRLMMLKANCDAIHKTGNLKNEYDTLIRVHAETDTHYIGNFEEGFGYINIHFRKDDCRYLTKEEILDLDGKWYCINEQPLYRIHLDDKGNLIKNKEEKETYIVANIFDKITKEAKYIEMINAEVSFYKSELEIGKSLIMHANNGGFIKTSNIKDIVTNKKNLEIITNNTVFVLKKK